MCGIAGVYGWTNSSILNEMLSSISHRGPDDEGTFIDEDSRLMMGMKRLSIVDLHGGAQPIYNEDETVSVVFNGEIYNHEELRQDLMSRGHSFCTQSDTEVLVHLWEEFGTDMPKHLNGMFAYSIWDEKDGSVFLARDRLGIKPLYYARTEDGFIWGSEIRSVLSSGLNRSVNEEAVYNYFSLRYTPHPETLFENIKKVPPGSSLSVSDEGINHQRYWSLPSYGVSGNKDAVSKKIRHLLEESVKKRLMADVPVGAFLSGGLDSSAIVALMSKHKQNDLKTFSVGFQDESIDETKEAEYVSSHFDTDHHSLEIDVSSMDVFSDVVKHCGEPLADPAILPTAILSKYASKEVKVVLTGEGADELFSGYYRYRRTPTHRRVFGWLPSPVFTIVKKLSRRTPFATKHMEYLSSLENDKKTILNSARRFDLPPELYLDTDKSPYSSGLHNKIEQILSETEDDFLKRVSKFDLTYWLSDDLLYKVDRASMSASLEARVPYLDHNLVEFAYNIPSGQKSPANSYKPVLKRAVSDIVPERILGREKQGFEVPIDEWFREDHDSIAGWLTEDNLKTAPYLDENYILDLWEEHRAGKQYEHTLWKALNYVAWYHEFVLDT